MMRLLGSHMQLTTNRGLISAQEFMIHDGVARINESAWIKFVDSDGKIKKSLWSIESVYLEHSSLVYPRYFTRRSP